MKTKIIKNKISYKNRIKEFREKKELSITDLSKITGIRYSTLRNVEVNGSFPNPKNREKIMSAMNCRFEEIFYEEKNN